MDDFGAQVRSIRSQLQLSQEEFATKLGVSFATVNRWESGKSKPQRAQRDALDALASEAGIGVDDHVSGPTNRGEPRRRRGISRSKVLGTRSMEQMLWDAACSIRGEKDAPKFKDYILPLLFIKRLSDVFDDELSRLAEQFGDRDTALALVEEEAKGATQPSQRLVRLYIPPEARWGVVSGRAAFDWPADRRPRTLGEQLTLTTRAIVRHNPGLAGVIDVVDFNETRNGEREISDAALKGVIETFSDPRYRLGLHDVEPDFLGRCYEYLLRKFAEGSGQSAGEFFTPTEVGFLMAEVLRPRPGEECYDYACGSFGLLVKLQLVCRRLDPMSKVPLRLYGQELQAESYAVACMNRIIHDMQGEVVRGDSMRNPKFREGDARLKGFDIVVANPMWNQPFDPEVYEHDPFGRFEEQGGTTAGKGDWAWLQHTLAAMKEGGRAAVVLDTGAMTRGSGSKNEDRERNIRRWFVEHDYIDGVILLPDNLFYNTTAAGVIVVLRKGKPKERREKIVLVNASQEFKKGSPKNYLSGEGIRRIAEALIAGVDEPAFVKVITTTAAAQADYDLSPSKQIATSGTRTFRSTGQIVAEITGLERELAAAYSVLRENPQDVFSTPWRETALGKEIDLEYGKGLAEPSRRHGPVPVFGSNGRVGWHDTALVDGPGIIVGRKGSVGAVTFSEGPFWPIDTTFYVRNVGEHDWYFLYYLLKQLRLGRLNSDTAVPGLNRQTALSLVTFMPPKDVQERLSFILRSVERTVELGGRLVATTSELFEALLDGLFTGGPTGVEPPRARAPAPEPDHPVGRSAE